MCPWSHFFGALVPTLAAYTSGSFDLYAEDLATFRVFVIAGAFVSFGMIVYSYITMSRIAQQAAAESPVQDYYLLIAAFAIIMQAISMMPPVYHAMYPLHSACWPIR